MKKIKTAKWQRQWAITKASTKAGSKAAGKLWFNALSEPFDAEKRNIKQQAILSEQAQQLVKDLGKLKGSVVKVGQMLALYGEYILPEQVHQALRSLEEDTEALDFEVIKQLLIESLSVEQYANLSIHPQAVGCASLAQVHKAYLHADEHSSVCFKVQYPGIKTTIQSDLNAILNLIRIGRFVTGDNFDDWVEDMRLLLNQELDYHREANMINCFSSYLEESKVTEPFLDVFRIPKVFSDYSNAEILCVEYMHGLSINELDLSHVNLQRRNKLAQAFLKLFLYEVFEWKTLQTDPNFDNYRVLLAEGNDSNALDTIALLDFGAVREFDESFIDALRMMIAGAYKQDVELTVRGGIKLGLMKADFPSEVLKDFFTLCTILLEPFCHKNQSAAKSFINEEGQYCWAKSQLPKRAAKHAAKSALSQYFAIPPKEFVLLSRKLLGVYAFIAALEAEFNPDGFLEPWL